VILPDATIILDYALDRLTRVIDNLQVYPDRMAENLDRTYGLVYSQRLLLKLIEAGMSREAAYDTVQPLAMRAWSERRPFREIIESSEAITKRLDAEAITDAFDPQYHLRHVDLLFERAGLG
jgi:adenylosuccinate lyase